MPLGPGPDDDGLSCGIMVLGNWVRAGMQQPLLGMMVLAG